jgi:hypothetical protein
MSSRSRRIMFLGSGKIPSSRADNLTAICEPRDDRCLLATKLFNKPPLAILNGTSNPVGLHNEHSLFPRISIHLHYDVKASKHLASLPTTD